MRGSFISFINYYFMAKTSETKRTKLLSATRDFQLLDHHLEHVGGVSRTVPDDTFSLRDIMNKAIAGVVNLSEYQRMVSEGKDPENEADVEAMHQELDLEKASRMEFSDKHALAASIRLSNIDKQKKADAILDKIAKAKADDESAWKTLRAEQAAKRKQAAAKAEGGGNVAGDDAGGAAK